MQHDDEPAVLGCTERSGQIPTRNAPDEFAAQALAQMEKARDFPANTCAASRHLALLAEAILRGEPCPHLADDPQHCAESMAWTVAALWHARTELAAERERIAELARSRPDRFASFADCDDFAECVLRGPNVRANLTTGAADEA